jgi:hypothetical protein
MLAVIIVSLLAISYVSTFTVGFLTIAEGPAFEHKTPRCDLRIGNTVYQAKAPDEAHIPINLTNYFCRITLENARVQHDAQKSYAR